MKLVVADDAAQAGRIGADLVLTWLEGVKRPRIGVATGSTPLPLYAALAGDDRTFCEADVFLVDEYCGLDPTDPRSYEETVRREFVERLGLERCTLHSPRTWLTGFDEHVGRCGGLDVEILGLGTNGHIGFNEPGTPFELGTHVVELSAATRIHNAEYFGGVDMVPTHAITQGVATILRARRLLLIVTGEAKAASLAAAVAGPVSPSVPASALQLHDAAYVVADAAAASRLPPE